MSAAQIELCGIERVFHLGDSEVHALRNLDLTISAGEYVAVMGPCCPMSKRVCAASALVLCFRAFTWCRA